MMSESPVTHYSAPLSQVQVPVSSTQDMPSVITGTAPPGTCTPSRVTSMAMVTPSPSIPGTTTSTHMDDTIYIKTQVFRLLRYYSPAPRNIARSD